MKLPPDAGKRLVAPAIVAVLLAGVGAVATVLSQQLVQRARAEQAQAAADRQSAQNRLARVTDEEREIREKLVDYRKLHARGLIGEESRGEWVEQIARIKAARKLFDLKYTIEPQRAADYPGIAGPGEVEFLVSQMRVDLALLHEEDLFRFIEDLRRALTSHVVVRACAMTRTDRPPTERGVAPRLQANCAIDLVTIRDRKAKAT
jgi:hypothetical protein